MGGNAKYSVLSYHKNNVVKWVWAKLKLSEHGSRLEGVSMILNSILDRILGDLDENI